MGQELNKEEDHVMPLAILAPALQFRPENAAWANVTAEFDKMEGGVCGHLGHPAQ